MHSTFPRKVRRLISETLESKECSSNFYILMSILLKDATGRKSTSESPFFSFCAFPSNHHSCIWGHESSKGFHLFFLANFQENYWKINHSMVRTSCNVLFPLLTKLDTFLSLKENYMLFAWCTLLCIKKKCKIKE